MQRGGPADGQAPTSLGDRTQRSPQLPSRSGVPGTVVPASPFADHVPYHVPVLTGTAMHVTTAGQAQQPHPSLPGLNSAQPASWVGQEPWPAPTAQSAATKEHAAVLVQSTVEQVGRHVANLAGPAAGARSSALHTRALSKPLPSQNPNARETDEPAVKQTVKSGQGFAALPRHPPAQLPQALSTPPVAVPEHAPSLQTNEEPVRAQQALTDPLEKVRVPVKRGPAGQSAAQSAAELCNTADPAVPTCASQLPTKIAAGGNCQSYTSSAADAPRVNAPQRMPIPARAAVPVPAARPATDTACAHAPDLTSPMHQRLALTTEESAVLAKASEPQDRTASNCQIAPRRSSSSVAAVAAKSVRPALSFGGARKQANSAHETAPDHALPDAAQLPMLPVEVASSAKNRPSVLTRKVLVQAELRQRPACTIATAAAASEPPSSSRTESVPAEDADDTVLSSSTDTDSLRSPPPQSATHRRGVTLKHLIDAGLLIAGPQVLKVPLNGCVYAAGVRHDGSVECDGNIVPNLSSLFNQDACGPLSEEKAWRLVQCGRWNLRHYRRLYYLNTGALCPPGILADSPRRSTAERPFALVQEEMMMAMAPADEPRSPPQSRVSVLNALPSWSSGATTPAPTLTGVKRTRRQEAVLQATEAEELAETLMKPAKLLASLPLNCLFERGIERYGVSPGVAVAVPAAKTPAVRSVVSLVPSTKATGPKAANSTAKLVVRPVGRPPKSAAKAATTSVDVVETFALPKAAPVVAAPAVEPLLQALDKMQRLPPMPRKVKTLAATMPRAPTAAPSSTAICPVDSQQRSRRDVRAPPRHNGVSGLDHTMMQLESYSKLPGEKGIDVQPFVVDVHPEAVAAMDIHAHMCQNEVIGVLGGTYDAEAGRLQVLRAVAVQEGPLDVGHTDVEMDAADQSRAVRCFKLVATAKSTRHYCHSYCSVPC